MWGRLKGYDAFLAALGVAALVDLALPILTTIALISIIGIPIAFLLMALPTVAAVLILGRLLQLAIRLPGLVPGLTSVVAVILLLAAGAAYYNKDLADRATTLLADDKQRLQPLKLATLGLIDDRLGWRQKNVTGCGDLCLRLLLNAVARKVVIFARTKDRTSLLPDKPGSAFWLEQRSECPAVVFRSDHENLPGEERSAPESSEVMALRLATGTCLVEGTATLDEVDTLAAAGSIASGSTSCAAGFDAGANTVSANRIALFQRGSAGLSETLRHTRVLWLPHPWILAPAIVDCRGLEMRGGFFRLSEVRNTDGKYFRDATLIELLTGKLNLQLAMSNHMPGTATDPVQIIAAALDSPGPIAIPVRTVIEDFFHALRDRKPLPEEKALAQRALADPRVPPPRATWALVQAMAKDGTEANARLAATLFDRLGKTPADQKEDHPTYLGWHVSYLDNGIRWLPDEAILPHKADLEALARDPAKRRRAQNSLDRLILFRRDVMETVLFLIEDAVRIYTARDRNTDSDMWYTPFRAGMRILCKLGPDAASAIPQVATWLQSGEQPLGHHNTGLIASTLLSMGAPDDLVIQVIGGLTTDSDKNNFAIWKRRVERGKPDCE
jgi:hypothetical protein